MIADTVLKDAFGEALAPIPFGGIYLPLEVDGIIIVIISIIGTILMITRWQAASAITALFFSLTTQATSLPLCRCRLY